MELSPTTIHSKHAKRRMQQRSIPKHVVDYLLTYADPAKTKGGAERYSFTRTSWQRLCAHLGREIRNIERYRRAYAVTANGVVVTVAWRQ
jgi:hypothetical protein